jgi:outer membrane receptor for ferrienterochelin and colicin
MRRLLTLLTAVLLTGTLHAQINISGRVTDFKDAPIAGASVSLDNTLDGATTDSAGSFTFTTTETGNQSLAVAAVGYELGGTPLTIAGANITGIDVRLKASAQRMEGFTVTAGYETSNDRNKAILTTLDIITTAGANADVVKAIQTLPGTQQTGTQAGLFVRGGDASEAAVIVDGLTAQNAFMSSAPGVAARSRFSPFQVKGVSFSSGGYSARYGQALSSVLELNTLDFPDKTTINAGVNMAGIYISGDKLWQNSAGSATAYYNNLTPFYGIATTNVDYYDVPKGGGGSARYAWKPVKGGMLKLLVNGAYFKAGTRVPDPDTAGKNFDYGLSNTNVYSSISYRQALKEKWMLYSALSYSYNKDDINAGGQPINQHDDRLQLRLEAKRFLAHHLTITGGAELQHFTYNRALATPTYEIAERFTENGLALYAEAEWGPLHWISIRPGLRYEHSALLRQDAMAPRMNIALRTGKFSQIGLAAGSFYQLPDVPYLLAGYKPEMQQAWHYIANFQWIKGDRTLRIEGYYKDYQELVREHASVYNPNGYRSVYGLAVDNSGYGYATGAELFWRDKKLIKNLDYWISYSYIDTRRFYKNFLTEATPDFISDHNLSVVAKYLIDKLQTQINITYSYASGRPYYNPNYTDNNQFLTDRTPDYHNLAFTVNYLTHIKKWFTVIYAGVDNVTNQHNIFGYRYNAAGTQRFAQLPALYRSFFAGVNFSLTEFDRDEL